MYTEIKDSKRIVNKKVVIETDLDTVLKEFNFKKLADCKWELSHFTISLYFFGEDKIPHIYLYYKEDAIAHYHTYFHRMWWHCKYSSDTLIEIKKDESVINDIMKNVRKKWGFE